MTSLDELLAEGVCECGTPLDTHPELPAVAPWRGWRSGRTNQATAATSRAGTLDSVFRRRYSANGARGPRRVTA